MRRREISPKKRERKSRKALREGKRRKSVDIPLYFTESVLLSGDVAGP